MRKVLASSLLTAEIAAFAMLMLLFFLNTNKPFLLLIPVAAVVGGYQVFKLLLRKLQDKSFCKALAIIIVVSFVLAALIAVLIIGILNILR